ncbi:MAG: amino acid permease, partial [Candidatus Eremiobacteraeota bacterium]|nr:amino acid permease [Candidatus Eremiobacteraeota bacterium]
IPRAILLSIAIVAALYVLLQIGVLGAVPWQSLLDAHGAPTTQAQYVGAFVVERTWGRAAAIGITGLVLITAFASLYGNLLGFSRISFAAARDGAFLPVFARLHPRKEIPHIALLAVGALSIIASFFTLDQVIAFLTAGNVLIQGIAQIVALAILRAGRTAAPFQMPFYPVPALVALGGWSWAFFATGTGAIALGVGWLAAGAIVYLIAARYERWWPFLLACLIALVMPLTARADSSWSTWNTSRITSEHEYPVFTVAGQPFFVYGAAFFYERMPRERWRDALLAYKNLGINTIDLYLIWNWHEPSEGVADFTGSTDPRRDLLALLKQTHELGFKLILRPGPVIRNEWRNGGYPPWLLSRKPYNMPLHDVLEGRYPATATLQNADAEAAAAEWLNNATHLRNAAAWLHDALSAVAPYSHDVIAIALDDDQGAYLDNNTWPAPRWHEYVGWLRRTVASVTGAKVPLFINTYEMRVPSASPAWAWGNWYQGNAYRIGDHDLADLDFATGLLQTQARKPVMQAEFQAGWFQTADEGAPRPSDPSNTTLALHELLRDGAHGIVNFPLQDTIYPHGWEVPWANWSYAWDAALTTDLHASARYAPTRALGDLVRAYGPWLARTHVAANAAIIWPATLFAPGTLNADDFNALASATITAQRACNARGLTCTLVDLATADASTPHSMPLVLPQLPAALTRRMSPWGIAKAELLQRSGRLVTGMPPRTARALGPNTSLLLADDGSYGFIVAVNSSDSRRHIGRFSVTLGRRNARTQSFVLPARSSRIIPVGIAAHAPSLVAAPALATPPPFRDPDGTALAGTHLRVVFGPFAGARIAEFGDGSVNAATGIGLMRDAVDPLPPPSARDYIASYTHPIAAGTFNRPYSCSRADALMTQRVVCTYDAPDIPLGGGRFSRTLTMSGGRELVIAEQFAPHDVHSSARLTSISGFAFSAGDSVLASSDARGILHRNHMVVLQWRRGDVASVTTRTTRGAEIVTLIFALRSVEMRLGFYPVTGAAEAQRLLDAKEP